MVAWRLSPRRAPRRHDRMIEGAAVELQRHIRTGFVTQALTFGLRFACGVLIARGLGPEGRGALTLALWVPSFFHVLLYWGLGEAALSMLNQRGSDRAAIVGSLNLLTVLLVAIGGLVYVAVAPWVVHGLKGQLSSALYHQAFWLIPLTLGWSYLGAHLLAFGKVNHVNWARVVNQGVLLLALLLWMVWLPKRPTVVLWAFILAAGLELSFMLGWLRREVPLRLSWNVPLFRRLFGLGGQFTLATIMDFLSRRVDIILVSLFGGVAWVGLYAVAVGLRDVFIALPQVFIRPTLSASARYSNIEGLVLLGKALRQAFVLLAMAGLALAWALPWVVRGVYTSAFDGAVVPARWLLIGMVALGLSDIVKAGFTGFGKPRPIVVTQAVSLGGVLGLGWLFARMWGIAGVAIAVSISQLIGLAGLLWFLRRYAAKTVGEPLRASWFRIGWDDVSGFWGRRRA